MWHEDLMPWQQIIETLVEGPLLPGAFQLCDQNPARVYLRISPVEPDIYGWLSTRENSGVGSGQVVGNQGTITASGSLGAETGNIDPVTGDVNLNTRSITINTTGIVRAVPFVEFFHYKHGILSQSQWWMYAASNSQIWQVIEVLMERNPCNSH